MISKALGSLQRGGSGVVKQTDRTTEAGKDSELTQGNHQPITARMVPGFVPGGAARSVTAIRKSQRGVAH